MQQTLQDYKLIPLIPSGVLSASTPYVLQNPSPLSGNFDLTSANQYILLIKLTLGTATAVQLLLEFSPDGTNWYQESRVSGAVSGSAVSSAVYGNTYTFASSGNFEIANPVKHRYMRITPTGTGTLTTTTLQVDVVVGVQ